MIAKSQDKKIEEKKVNENPSDAEIKTKHEMQNLLNNREQTTSSNNIKKKYIATEPNLKSENNFYKTKNNIATERNKLKKFEENSPFADYTPKQKKFFKKNDSKKTFNLNSIIHLPPMTYNPLKDQFLRAYYVKEPIQQYLKKQKFITRGGYIIENPDRYQRNLKLLKQHHGVENKPKMVRKSSDAKTLTQSNNMSKSQGNFRITRINEFDKKQSKPNLKHGYDEQLLNSQDHMKFIADIKNQYTLN